MAPIRGAPVCVGSAQSWAVPEPGLATPDGTMCDAIPRCIGASDSDRLWAGTTRHDRNKGMLKVAPAAPLIRSGRDNQGADIDEDPRRRRV